MTLACDFAYAAEGARFGLPEAGLGIMPGLGGTQLLTRAVGPRRAMEFLTTAAPISAEKALEIGLVNGVVPAEALVETVKSVAAQIASRAPLSVRGLKRVVRDGQDLDLAAAMTLELEIYYRLFKTADRREGVASFNEKRAPAFQGR
jgi:enoyl-CoA hydratase/carnithine racemase